MGMTQPKVVIWKDQWNRYLVKSIKIKGEGKNIEY